MSKYNVANTCRCCGSDVISYLNLGDQPLANSYHYENETLDTYPLCLAVCQSCFHNQLTVVVDPDEMFKNYLYVSGTAKTLHDYFDWFAEYTVGRKSSSTDISVLDIACNDGTQLTYYKQRGCEVWGVDPAENLTDLAKNNGVNIKVAYWDSNVAQELITTRQKPFDIITAQNVFAHTHDILEFLSACKLVMDDSTDLYIQTSQARMFDENQFDTAYHEHLSFFNTKSMKTIVERAGLFLNEVQLTNIHGISYVFRINKTAQDDSTVVQEMRNEELRGLYSMETYHKFADNAKTVVTNLVSCIQELKKDGYKVIGYGAAAKGMTVLNFANIDSTLISYIIDDNPLKVGRLTPGSNIPIKSADVLDIETEKLAVIPLAWNFFEEISMRVKSRVKSTDVRYVKYFPTLHVSE